MLALTNTVLLEHLRQSHYDAQLQPETQQIVCIVHLAGRDFPMFFRVDEAGKVLQLLIFMPTVISPNAASELGRLLHALNKELDLPGFGMDEGAGVIFYRCVMPTTTGKVDTALFDNLMVSIPRVAHLFFPLIAVVAGGKSFDSVVGQMRDILKRFAHQK